MHIVSFQVFQLTTSLFFQINNRLIFSFGMMGRPRKKSLENGSMIKNLAQKAVTLMNILIQSVRFEMPFPNRAINIAG
ncbi:hypothetical protein ES703_46299 [subsurface metagenome]